MLCEDVKKYFDEYMDDELSPALRDLVQEHLDSCPACRQELESYTAFCGGIAGLPLAPLPADFELALADRLSREKSRFSSRPLYRRGWFKALAGCACLLLLIGAVAVLGNRGGFDMMTASAAPSAYSGADKNAAGAYMMDMPAEAPAEPMPAPEPAPMMEEADMEMAMAGDDMGIAQNDVRTKSQTIQRKIIKNCSISIKVEDFDQAYAQVQTIASQFGGYVVSGSTYQDSYSNYRDGHISIRVEYQQVDAAVAAISQLGQVDSSSFSTDDVTREYYDIASRLEQYQTQEERLLALYDQAETIEDLISLESELTRIQSEIESLQGMINYYDQLTSLSLIDVYLYTPSAYTQTVEPQGWQALGQDIREGFLRGINNLLDGLASLVVWLVSSLPVLIILAVIIVALILLIRRRRRK